MFLQTDGNRGFARKKQTVLGSEKFTYNENQLVVTSIDIPTVGSIVEASPEKPFMTLILDLDSYLISQLLSEGNYPHNETARGAWESPKPTKPCWMPFTG